VPILAAIDVGSNAMRLAVASVDAERHVTLIEVIRESVRLGQDAFTSGIIAEQTLDVATEAFLRFRETIDRHGARWTRAVATSAVREALNQELFVDRVSQASKIDIEVIGPEEEARLIYTAVNGRVNLRDKLAVLVDIGGGSTEITLASDEGILSTESYKMGSVRLLRTLGGQAQGEQHIHQLIQEYVEATQKRIRRELGRQKIDLCIGTGGNMESLGDLRREDLGRDRDTVLPVQDLQSLLKLLMNLSYEERVRQLRLRPDRADVIIPAALIMLKIMQIAGVDELTIPRVGLKDGLLADMAEELYGERKTVRRDQVIASALQVGRKFQFDELHALTVSKFAVQLFDRTRELHHLGLEHRLLLEVAAMLHDIGGYVGAADHHKHSQYLLLATPIVGLKRDQVAIIGNIARYHRKSLPKPQHELYKVLPSRDKVIVSKLAALLRLADAMDNEHGSKVSDFEVEYRKPKFTIRLHGEGDLLLEKWALNKKSDMFEEVFSVKCSIAE
jgi:exopolyphosphatase/guanosine-5'-triphosphate,3'-diphosphate pyrophosphatase